MAAFAAALRAGRRGRPPVAAAVDGRGGIALIAAVGGAWLGTRARGPAVAPAAEMLAILPFNASGPGVGLLGEGMVDLLSTNLQGVGGIRTVEPRAVLHGGPPRQQERATT